MMCAEFFPYPLTLFDYAVRVNTYNPIPSPFAGTRFVQAPINDILASEIMSFHHFIHKILFL
jgi:hypothetical protein